jgi:hypothetical protein
VAALDKAAAPQNPPRRTLIFPTTKNAAQARHIASEVVEKAVKMTGVEPKKRDLAEETKERLDDGMDDVGQYPASGKMSGKDQLTKENSRKPKPC